jgi:formamidopyrimidine-DNA glycosylase
LPELPEVEAVRRRLEPVMAGARFTRVTVRRPDLRIPFPRRFAARLTGETVAALTRRAKYLVAELSSGETLLMHLGMSGSFRVERGVTGKGPALRPPGRHDHVVFEMSNGALVTFTDPRRFGFMDLLTPRQVKVHPALSTRGPEPLSEEFDASSLAMACRGRKASLKATLLDQRVVAGLGNIYVSEALHRAGVSPLRAASTIATASGKPRPAAHRLSGAIKEVLLEAIERRRNPSYRVGRFRVYDRENDPCLTKGCGGTIQRRTQGARSTFYCPSCQR